MRKVLLLAGSFICCIASSFGQTKISGTVTDKRGEVLPGANVYIQNSYDGATTDSNGNFSFDCFEQDTQMLIVSFVGFEKYEKEIVLSGKPLTLGIELKEAFNEANTVQISAGGFGANDRKKAIVLNPLDIVTTAGANGDIFRALETLPGTTPVGENAGLFVRGGDASETRTVIDELIVQRPFFSTVPDIPSRSQFSPFLFEGTFFSTGGYSARYGQALSSALILNSQGLPDTTTSGLSFLAVGLSAFHAKKWKKTSLTGSVSYNDLAGLFLLNKQRPNWEIPPRSANGTLIFRHKTSETGILKFYGSYFHNRFVVKREDPFNVGLISRTKLNSTNLYLNTTYKELLNNKWAIYGGASFSQDRDQIRFNADSIGQRDQRAQAKIMLTRYYGKNSSLWIGAEAHDIRYRRSFNPFRIDLEDQYLAAFAETEFFLSTKLAARVGARGEYSDIIKEWNVAPRLSLAYKLGKYSQVSAAFGQFYQTPSTDSLFDATLLRGLGFERADHYLVNYQFIKDKRTLRAEAYYKTYANLVRWGNGQVPFYNNTGEGFARGFDLFFRDQKTIKNADYWLSYSFLDTRRLYQQYPKLATPNFASAHVFSAVYKQFISSIRTSFGATYTYSAGRPFYNPNLSTEQFLSQRTPDYHMFNLNASYLTTIKNNFTVLFVSLNNVFGRDNIFGYRFSADGTQSIAVRAPAIRTFFVGLFISFRP